MALGYRRWDAGNCPDCGSRDEWFFDEAAGIDDPQAMYPNTGVCRGCQLREVETAMIPPEAKGRKVALFPDATSPAGRRIIRTMEERDD